MKTRKLYEIKAGHGETFKTRQLRSYNRARKLAGYMRRRYGIDTYIAGPWKVAA